MPRAGREGGPDRPKGPRRAKGEAAVTPPNALPYPTHDPVTPLLLWLLRTSAGAAVVAGLVLLVQAAFGRRLTAAWRYRLWGLVVLRMLLPALPASPVSLWRWDVAGPVRWALAVPS